MEIVEVTSKEYASSIQWPYHIFATTDFNNLNRDKCEEVHYLLFKDTKVRLGIIGGVKNNMFLSPFSAPFGGFTFIKNDIKIQQIDQALDVLQIWLRKNGLLDIQITLPPSIYKESFISKLTNSFYRKGFKTSKLDLNYSFNSKNFGSDYTNLLWRNARKNLNVAIKQNFIFKVCETLQDKQIAYNIIQKNREVRGFPLRMSWDAIVSTIAFLKADFFHLCNVSQEVLASAMIYHINPEIVQVVYWGDLPKYSHLKTMNFLSYKIFEYYKNTTIKIIDIGPSTEDSIPNFGLCEFKESIGCDISSKLTFSKKI